MLGYNWSNTDITMRRDDTTTALVSPRPFNREDACAAERSEYIHRGECEEGMCGGRERALCFHAMRKISLSMI